VIDKAFDAFSLFGGNWQSMAREKADSRAYKGTGVDAMLVARGLIIPKFNK